MALSGRSIIGQSLAPSSNTTYPSRHRQSGISSEPPFHEATQGDVDEAVRLAATAFRDFAHSAASARASFLDAIAERLEAQGETIVERAHDETGLPIPRLGQELFRTCGQLRFFAGIVRKGHHLDIRIDLANPNRQPTPMPEIRSMLRPLGPVVVFGASNFPLAFSVAGGDTASALAAGCPVIARAHPEHPGTSEFAGQAIREAAKATGMPEGVFSMLHLSHAAAAKLLTHAEIAAAGFTGSKAVGMRLFQIAANRPHPIPFYAEMSSLNPVLLLPGALAKRGETIAKALCESLTLGVGQYCTNPGLIFTVGEASSFGNALKLGLETIPPGRMATDALATGYLSGAETLEATKGVSTLIKPTGEGAVGLFKTNLATFLSEPSLREELFGPAAVWVECQDIGEAISGLRALDGQLTGTLHLEDSEIESATELFIQMERMSGRLIVNGMPTGVEVCDSMVHGGPFPATSDGRSTSVGGRALLRWMRAVCYQEVPDELLPPELRPPAYT